MRGDRYVPPRTARDTGQQSLSNACDEAPDGLLTASVLERHGQAQRAETAWVVSQPGPYMPWLPCSARF